MKHLVKKYVKKTKLNDDVMEVINNAPIDEKKIKELSDSNLDGYYGIAITTDNEFIQTFKYLHNKKTFLIPEPDPIVIYFDTARNFHKEINKRRDDLFSKLSKETVNIVAVNGDFYWYFSVVSNYAIFLFLSLEAFINKMIPLDFEYKKRIPNKRTELYNKSQIQKHIEFLEKIKNVLPEVFDKNFVTEQSHKYDLIKKLKEFRDEIVHTKSYQEKGTPNFYENLFVTSLDFDFDKTLYASRDFINYYQPNLIEECHCEK